MGAMNTVYHKRNFNVYSVNKKEFIVHNASLNFNEHHTHINRFSTAKYLINISIYKTIPKRLSDYLIVSLIRLTDDNEYKDKLYELLHSHSSFTSSKYKKQNYYNKTKSNRR